MGKKNKKSKKRIKQKRNNRLIFIILIIIIISIIFLIQKREDEILANTEEIKISDILNIIEEKQASVSRYVVYGTHMNIEGNIDINNSEIKDTNIVLKKVVGDELVIDTTYEYENGKLSFSTLKEINKGLNLEGLNIENYFVLLKVSYSNGEVKYYSLKNDTEYREPINYYTLTRNGKNNKINIEFITENNKSALVLNVVEITKLPEDIYDIVIDPGHGGSDSGAVSGKYEEEEIVLKYGLELKEKLENLGLKVLITRDGTEGEEYDMYNIYDKNGRVTIANKSGAKILISLHLNSNDIDLVHGGVEVYLAPNMDNSLAKLFASNIVENANTTYSKMESFKEENGVYVRTIDIGNRTYGTFKGYKGIYDEAAYLFIIRETGGIATGAYVNGNDSNYGENIYRNSNVGIEGYLIELGYMNVNRDLRNILNNRDLYIQAITDTINSFYKIKE